MHFDWATFALQTVNFAILVWLLHRFLYKPVLRFVDARRAEIAKQYAAARSAECDAKEQLAAIAAERAGIAVARATALKEAAAEAEAAAVARRTEVEREGVQLLDAARKTLDGERRQALAEVQRVALDLAGEIAGRLLAEMPVKLRSDAWCARIEQHLEALPRLEREALTRQLGDEAKLTVVTANALPLEAAQDWRTRLHRALGLDVTIEFEVDPDLIAGADLYFPNAVLHFSWRDLLTAIRKEIVADANRR